MILNIPFFENSGDGNQCMQVGMRTAIKYFLDKEISLDELSTLSKRKPNKWTFSAQIVPVLFDMGLVVKLYSKNPLEPFLKGEDHFRKKFGNDFDKVKNNFDFPVIVSSTKQLLALDLFEQTKISIAQFEQHLDQGHIVLVLLDSAILYQKNSHYQGHFVVLTGYDEDFFYYHESGPMNPTPNKKADKKLFVDAMDGNGTDNDCVIISGKRSS